MGINEDETALDCVEIYPEFTVTYSDDGSNVEYNQHYDANNHPSNLEDDYLEDGDYHFEVVQDVIAQRVEITGVQEILSNHNNNDEDDLSDVMEILSTMTIRESVI
jgi:3-dehydroquinate dehydratase